MNIGIGWNDRYSLGILMKGPSPSLRGLKLQRALAWTNTYIYTGALTLLLTVKNLTGLKT
jgi:hypothetical protein